jgi:ureidoacrylate peracid hydrolase
MDQCGAGLVDLFLVMMREPSDRFRLTFVDSQPDRALWPTVDHQSTDWMISKNRFTPFADPSRALELRVRLHDIGRVLIAGTVTNVCCECTARDAARATSKRS